MKGHKFNKSIFRAYDIRGIVADTLSVQDAYYIGYNFAKKIRAKFKSVNIVVGYDGRLSSPILEKSLIQGLFDNGANIIRIGLCPSPMLYFASIRLRAEGAIMITGSHNPSNYNGFKILTKEGSYFGKELLSLMKIKIMPLMHGKIHYFDISNSYISNLVSAISFKNNNLKVVWDPGNGSTGNIIKKLIKHIPGEHILINSDVDGTFPSHHPDPTEEKNLVEIKKTIKKYHADIGIAFDGDGDRIGIIDDKGRILSGDKILLIFAYDLLEKQKASVIGDVKCSQVLFDEIKRMGGNPIMSKTGHSHIKVNMKKYSAKLAGEMSGHIFFADKYYGFDDALYAAIRLLTLTANNIELDKFMSTLPETFVSPEIKVFCSDEIKFLTISNISKKVFEKYNSNEVITLDGLRVKNNHGWWLIRASNTEEALVVRFEGKSEKGKEELFLEVKNLLKNEGLTLDNY